jgi:hypothetical protein
VHPIDKVMGAAIEVEQDKREVQATGEHAKLVAK